MNDRPDKTRPGRPKKPRPPRRQRGRRGCAKPKTPSDQSAAQTALAGAPERIAKRLARSGVASRRDAEAMIAEGRVKVNGKVLDSPAFNVQPTDRIEVDDAEIAAPERTRLFLFHKPAGVVTTNRDPEGRRTVFDVLPKDLPRLMTVGRLDIGTEGLLLLTNDGGLARVLELPATGWLRRYRVRVHGKVDPKALEDLREGIAVDGVFYGAVEATLDREMGTNAWLTVGLREGKNREVKNILSALGLDVTRLIRVSYGPFQLADLPEGTVREIRGRTLRDQLGERLIAEAGANFDAPVAVPFSSKSETKKAGDESSAREARGPRQNAKRRREEGRESALGRLQTKPPRPGKRERETAGRNAPKSGRAGGDRDAAEAEKTEQRGRRTSNVWMAPGARPLSDKQKAEKAERTEGRRYAGKPKPQGAPGRVGAPDEGERRPRRSEGDRPAARSGGKPSGGSGQRRDDKPGASAGRSWTDRKGEGPRGKSGGQGAKPGGQGGKPRPNRTGPSDRSGNAGKRPSSSGGPARGKRGDGGRPAGPRKPRDRN